MTGNIPLMQQVNEMQRQYHTWFSTWMKRDMELLVFGHAGKPVIFFPTRTARFYDYEDWKVIEALKPQIAAGQMQVICLDSADKDSFYNKDISPAERILKHELFEKYVLFEVIPFIKETNKNPNLISAGCSLGAYHAVNLAFRYPHLFKKVVALSGRYDITITLPFFADLFDGYRDENIYLHMPSQYVPNIQSPQILRLIKKLEITIVIGEDDAFLENNKQFDEALTSKGINHAFYIWKGEAHKAQYWIEMVKLYL